MMPKLHKNADPTIRALWRMGYDTADLARYFNDRKGVFNNGFQRIGPHEFFSEADVYNALDRARDWVNQRIVKVR